jgi:hypothetical protein
VRKAMTVRTENRKMNGITQEYLRTANVILTMNVRTGKRGDARTVSYIISIKSNLGEQITFSIRTWYPIIEYLATDGRYIRGRDYDVVKEQKSTKAGIIDTAKFFFYNSECARRVTVFALSILGVETKSYWVYKMMRAVRKLSLDAIDFWFVSALDRYVTYKNGRIRRRKLLRLGKALRLLYAENGDYV